MPEKIKELRGLIYAKYNSEADFAKRLAWPKQKLNRITNGRKEPNLQELNDLSKGLDRSVESIAQIFLRRKSPNGQRIDKSERR